MDLASLNPGSYGRHSPKPHNLSNKEVVEVSFDENLDDRSYSSNEGDGT